MTKFETLTEAQFTKALQTELGIQKAKDAEFIAEGMETVIHQILESGKGFKIRGLGTFKIKILAERSGTMNGTAYHSPRRLDIDFTPAKAVIEKLRAKVAVPE